DQLFHQSSPLLKIWRACHSASERIVRWIFTCGSAFPTQGLKARPNFIPIAAAVLCGEDGMTGPLAGVSKALGALAFVTITYDHDGHLLLRTGALRRVVGLFLPSTEERQHAR